MSAKLIAERFLAKHGNKVYSRKERLDPQQLVKASCVLGSRITPDCKKEGQEPASAVPIPPGWHLAYFTPSLLESELGRDGSDQTFNPEPPFTRRMWAGGKMTWHRPYGLESHRDVLEETRVFKAEPKSNKKGEEFIVAGVEKRYSMTGREARTPEEVVLTDQREWVFRPEVKLDTSDTEVHNLPSTTRLAKPYQKKSRIIATSHHTQTPVSLFRFSALTFNAHQIHYSQPWTRRIEGHPEIVVHAPLNLILMLELYRKTRLGAFPDSIEYRAVSPLYAGEEYRINLAESGEVWCERKEDGGVCMTGRIASSGEGTGD